MGEKLKVAYLCDGLDKCSDCVMCYRRRVPGAVCKNTFNPEHAIKGAVEHPENYPERFHLLDVPEEELCWWEGEIDIP